MLWPRPSSTLAVACVMLVLLVLVLLSLSSLLLSSGPRCLTSWPVWTRRTVFCEHGVLIVDSGSGMCHAGIAGCLLFALSSLLLSVGPDARHHGRNGPEGQSCHLHEDRGRLPSYVHVVVGSFIAVHAQEYVIFLSALTGGGDSAEKLWIFSNCCSSTMSSTFLS